MFNADRKTDFINYYFSYRPNAGDAYRRNVESKLRVIGSHIEDIYEKDACDLSYDEAVTAITSVGAPSYGYRSGIILLLKDYTNWCIDNGLSANSSNPYELISVTDISTVNAVQATLLSGYEHMAEYLDELCSPVDDTCADNMYRAAMWLVFFGISVEKVGLIANGDYNNGVLVCGGKQYDFNAHPEVKTVLDTIKDQTHRLRGVSKVAYGNTDTLLKSDYTEYDSKRIKNGIYLLCSAYNKSVGEDAYALKAIEKSGLFWRMKNAENSEERSSIANDYISRSYMGLSPRNMAFRVRALNKDYNAWCGKA